MMRKFSLLLAVLLILLLAACNYPVELPNAPASQQAGEEIEETEFDYCDLPGGTKVTWFDLSTFIFIPKNSYQMGFNEPAGEFDFEPSHPVSLGAFWMHETEVTNRQYANCVSAGQCAPPKQFGDVPYWFEEVQDLDDPVVGATWEQADAYCEWIGTRLPTEAEWELAARGMNSEPYPWGKDAPDCEYANYQGCLDPEEDQPHFAGLLSKGISPFQMLDMAGNANEWVSDWYAKDYYQNSPSVNPTGPDSGELRVWRGGGYQSAEDEVLAYLRNALKPDEARPDLGFRCAWSCGSNVTPQLCYMPPLVGQPTPPMGKPPSPYTPQIIGEGYCEWKGGSQSAGIVLSSPNGADLSQFKFSSPDGPLTCDPVGINQYVCYGTTVKSDNLEVITACPDCGEGFYFNQASKMCEPLMYLDPELVELLPLNEDPESWCPPEQYWISGQCFTLEELESTCIPSMKYEYGCGCIWLWETCGEAEPTWCPLGFEWKDGGCVPLDGWGNDMPTHCFPPEILDEPCGCIPYGSVCLGIVEGLEWTGPMIAPAPVLMPEEPLLPGNISKDPEFYPLPEECNGDILHRCPPGMISLLNQNGCQECVILEILQDCPEGYSFDPVAGCCYPDLLVSLCPPETYFDALSNACLPIVKPDQSCIEIEMYVPACGPKPRPTPGSNCKNPGLYRSQSACEAASCKWEIDPASGAGSCTYP